MVFFSITHPTKDISTYAFDAKSSTLPYATQFIPVLLSDLLLKIASMSVTLYSCYFYKTLPCNHWTIRMATVYLIPVSSIKICELMSQSDSTVDKV